MMIEKIKQMFVKQTINGNNNIQAANVTIQGGILENLHTKLNEWDLQSAHRLFSFVKKATEIEENSKYRFRLDENDFIEIRLGEPDNNDETIFKGMMYLQVVDDIPSSFTASQYADEKFKNNEPVSVKLHEMYLDVDGDTKPIVKSEKENDENLIRIDFYMEEYVKVPSNSFIKNNIFKMFPLPRNEVLKLSFTHDEYVPGIDIDVILKRDAKQEGYEMLEFTNSDIHSPFYIDLKIKIENQETGPKITFETLRLDVKEDTKNKTAHKAMVVSLLENIYTSGMLYVLDKEKENVFFSSTVNYESDEYREKVVKEYELKKDFWTKLHKCEKTLNITFDVPPIIKPKEINTLNKIYHVVKNGKVKIDFENVSIPFNESDFMKNMTSNMVNYMLALTYEGYMLTLFGQEVNLGETVVILPPVKVKSKGQVEKAIKHLKQGSVVNVDFVPKTYHKQVLVFTEHYKSPLRDIEKIIEAEFNILAKEISTVSLA